MFRHKLRTLPIVVVLGPPMLAAIPFVFIWALNIMIAGHLIGFYSSKTMFRFTIRYVMGLMVVVSQANRKRRFVEAAV
jgi:hypothetical protein